MRKACTVGSNPTLSARGHSLGVERVNRIHQARVQIPVSPFFMPEWTAPPGMRDYFGSEAGMIFSLEEQFTCLSEKYGYQPIRTPLIEMAELFYKGTGESSEIVQKEMYEFTDRGGRKLALRPESTPSVARALIEHHFFGSPSKKFRLYYFGPMFRYDRPQKGRYRLFHQVGVEAIGWKEPELDVEVILLLLDYLTQLGVSPFKLVLNSLGCSADRKKYHKELSHFLKKIRHELPEEEQGKIERNPMRILDSKQSVTREVLDKHPALPKTLSFLCKDCEAHFAEVCEGLKSLGREYELSPFLVRGLDYYTRTVFEVISPELGAQDSLGGGGRYDDLFSLYSDGKIDLPCVGFAAGLERILATSSLQGKMQSLQTLPPFRLLLIALDELSRKLLYPFRYALIQEGIPTDIIWGKRLKSALSYANRMKFPYCGIMGENERNTHRLILRDMQKGSQEEIPFEISQVVEKIR